MSPLGNVSPASLPVHAGDEGIEITYLDDRRVTYRATPESTQSPVRVQERSQVHVLIVGPDGDAGRLVSINDRKTSNNILERTGVGRVLLDDGGEATLAPGVDVHRSGEELIVHVSPVVGERRILVFVDTQRHEHAYEVAPTASAG